MMKTGTKTPLDALTQRPERQAMLTALTIISLLSLLVATEAEPTSSPAERATEQPLRPKPRTGSKEGNSDRLAA
jgi:hypothetical protein